MALCRDVDLGAQWSELSHAGVVNGSLAQTTPAAAAHESVAGRSCRCPRAPRPRRPHAIQYRPETRLYCCDCCAGVNRAVGTRSFQIGAVPIAAGSVGRLRQRAQGAFCVYGRVGIVPDRARGCCGDGAAIHVGDDSRQRMRSQSREILKEALQLVPRRTRRNFLRQGLTLGGLSMLAGCSVLDEDQAEAVLARVSRFNDRMQAWLFNPNRLAPTYDASQITRPFPFNAFYSQDEAPQVDASTYRLEVSGLVADKHPWSLNELGALPQSEQITRHICVEGWSAIGRWGGVRFATFLRRIGADLAAKYVGFKCADGYYESIDMPTALHAQTLLTMTYDRQVLPRAYGFPLKLRMPTKL